MGYRIEYDAGSSAFEIRQEKPTRLGWLGLLAVAVVTALLLWPAGAEKARELLIPGDDAVTVQALEGMAEDLKAGASFSDAVSAFCREVIRGAEASN